jgi:hypothetical protein
MLGSAHSSKLMDEENCAQGEVRLHSQWKIKESVSFCVSVFHKCSCTHEFPRKHTWKMRALNCKNAPTKSTCSTWHKSNAFPEFQLHESLLFHSISLCIRKRAGGSRYVLEMRTFGKGGYHMRAVGRLCYHTSRMRYTFACLAARKGKRSNFQSGVLVTFGAFASGSVR